MTDFLHSPAKNILVRWLLITASLLLFFIVWLVFIAGNITPDEKIFSAVASHVTPGRTSFMKAVSFLGSYKFLIPANILIITWLIIRKNKWGAITTAAVALSSLGLMSLLKNLIQRQRPDNRLVEGITNFSFPSGHAFMSVAFYGLLAGWAITHLKNTWPQRLFISFLLLLILFIGFSRIYLRVHYFTDVVGGFCIGIIWLITVLVILHKIQVRYNAKKK